MPDRITIKLIVTQLDEAERVTLLCWPAPNGDDSRVYVLHDWIVDGDLSSAAARLLRRFADAIDAGQVLISSSVV